MMSKFIKIDDEVVKPIKKHSFWHYIVHIIGLSVGFTLGYYYHVFDEIKSKDQQTKIVNEVTRSSVSIAIDDHSNLLIINKTTGDYTIYQDSVGVSIFNLYAKTIIKNN